MRGSAIVIEPMPIVVGPGKTVLVAPASTTTIGLIIEPLPAISIQAAQRPAWDDKGWTPIPHHSRRAFEGFYRVRLAHTGEHRRFAGRLMETRRGIAAYIADPPPEVRRHPKGPCFALVEDPWFRVHWQQAPRDADEAILYIERVLDEALNQYRG